MWKDGLVSIWSWTETSQELAGTRSQLLGAILTSLHARIPIPGSQRLACQLFCFVHLLPVLFLANLGSFLRLQTSSLSGWAEFLTVDWHIGTEETPMGAGSLRPFNREVPHDFP